MAAGISYPDLETALRAIGKGYCYIGDLFAVGGGGMTILGATEGEIRVALNETYNPLKFDEYFGDAEVETTLKGESPMVTIPLILGDDDLYDIISPVGSRGGGFSRHQSVVTTSMIIVPESELPDAPAVLSFSGGPPAVWAPAEPDHVIYLFRGYFKRPGLSYKQADGGKVIIEVNFQVIRMGSLPEGYQLYGIGAGVTTAVDTIRI